MRVIIRTTNGFATVAAVSPQAYSKEVYGSTKLSELHKHVKGMQRGVRPVPAWVALAMGGDRERTIEDYFSGYYTPKISKEVMRALAVMKGDAILLEAIEQDSER